MAVPNFDRPDFQQMVRDMENGKKFEKQIVKLDRLFAKLYEDNVSGKISDERFEVLSKSYKSNQKQLKATVAELTSFVERREQQNSDMLNLSIPLDTFYSNSFKQQGLSCHSRVIF